MDTTKLEKALSICAGNDPWADWMASPMSNDGWNWATDRYVLGGFQWEHLYPEHTGKRNVARVLGWLTGNDATRLTPAEGTLKASDIRAAMKAWPPDIYSEDTWNKDEYARIDIHGIAHFGIRTISKLYEVIKVTRIKSFRITHGSETGVMRLEAGSLVFCMMPMMQNREPFHTITP